MKNKFIKKSRIFLCVFPFLLLQKVYSYDKKNVYFGFYLKNQPLRHSDGPNADPVGTNILEIAFSIVVNNIKNNPETKKIKNRLKKIDCNDSANTPHKLTVHVGFEPYAFVDRPFVDNPLGDVNRAHKTLIFDIANPEDFPYSDCFKIHLYTIEQISNPLIKKMFNSLFSEIDNHMNYSRAQEMFRTTIPQNIPNRSASTRGYLRAGLPSSVPSCVYPAPQVQEKAPLAPHLTMTQRILRPMYEVIKKAGHLLSCKKKTQK